jgi:hypothetical protein
MGGEGGKRSFTLINRGGQKSFNAEKGGGSKKFLNLNTMSRVLISIITKEDSENAISNDLETQNFQDFPARRQPWLRLVGVAPDPSYPLSCGIYINIPCMYT